MKLGIITFQNANNYGAILQAYALKKYISSMGNGCDVINYHNQIIEKTYKPHLVINKGLIKLLGSMLNSIVLVRREKAFRDFRSKVVNTNVSFNVSTIKEANSLYDGFVFGSDQIWNTTLTGRDFGYLGNFVEHGKIKVSYAASIGKRLTPKEIDEIAPYLSSFSAISVREKYIQDSFSHINNIEVVADPVFLLNKKDWLELAGKKALKEKYILLYHLKGADTKIDYYAEWISKRTGYKVVEFQAWAGKRPRNYQKIYDGTPNDFITYIRDAEYIVTDSFHCVSLSIILEKKFWTNIPAGYELGETRVGNVLSLSGLIDRLVPKQVDLWDYNAAVNSTKESAGLDSLIESSKRFLYNNLC